VRLLCEGFAAQGADVFLLAAAVPMKPIPMAGVTEWRYSNIHDVDLMDSVLTTIQPDICLVFGCTEFIAHYLQLRSTPPNCPTYFWLPYEGSFLPKKYKKQFRGLPVNHVIHLSEFGRRLWGKVAESDVVIPHCIDTDIWKYDEDFTKERQWELRKKWAERFRFPFFEDAFVVINLDRNIWHKRWDATFDYVARLQKRMPDRRVQLVAHALMNQPGDQGHPPGFNLPYLERVYGLHHQICYTGFDWGDSLEREDLVELCQMSDIRLTTSQGEGFGIPTVECAALGKLQILNNHTTMPELVGKASPMLVEPAMTEDKEGSLFQVPNTQAMVDCTLEFLNDPEMAQNAVATTRDRVETKFTQKTVIDQFVDVFKTGINGTTRADLQYEYRWGYQKQFDMPKVWGDLGRSCSKLKERGTILEVGSFMGDFLEMGTEFGLNVQGIENDERALQHISARVRSVTQKQDFTDEWPYADIVVCTDMHDRWFADGGMERLKAMLERIAFYEWACLRWRPVFKWGQANVSPIACRGILEGQAMVRRIDLEEKLKIRFPDLEHEIWRRGNDKEFVPDSLKD
jgi:glycosyltransferase involved in cell wall biosynthesis